MSATSTPTASGLLPTCGTTLLAMLLLAGVPASGHAAEGRTFEAVTPAIFECLKTTSSAEHGTVYESADGLSGAAVTATALYTVRLGFVFDPVVGSLSYTLISKSFIVPLNAIWSGIEETLGRCR